ncbi:N-acetyltransferase [Aeromicrobium sp. S22]|uniref:N-acetyltransferase n=1 Tax=Aeromicrobium sp. S22 TaxID=2662029 RepID=UPI00129DC03B|nr:N-acetyltransferase [Aeromicrobium sp. S22]MRK01058.1 N-acetyltransferase [Aeromicrobium sp. S22]
MNEPERRGHPLGELIAAAADGRFPEVDGGWERVRPWRPGLEAVVAFTGHAVLAVSDDVTDARLEALGVDGFGGAHDPRLMTALAGPDAWIDVLDVLLVARGRGSAAHPSGLVARPDLAGHPRVLHAAVVRDDVEVWGHADPMRSAVAILARGIGGLRELSFEIEPARRKGAGAALIEDALRVVPWGEVVVAAAAPGNAASLRALLRAGFTPVGSVQLFRRSGPSGPGDAYVRRQE